MANEIKQKYGVSQALTITIASLANGSARQSTQVVTASPVPRKVRIFGRIRTGTSPTAGSLLQLFIARADDDATTEHRTGNVGTTDAAYSGNTDQLELVFLQNVTSGSNTDYYFDFEIDEPGTDWVIVLLNSTGAALDSTGGNHWIRYRTISPEVQ